jgi:hypothetical protein
MASIAAEIRPTFIEPPPTTVTQTDLTSSIPPLERIDASFAQVPSASSPQNHHAETAPLANHQFSELDYLTDDERNQLTAKKVEIEDLQNDGKCLNSTLFWLRAAMIVGSVAATFFALLSISAAAIAAAVIVGSCWLSSIFLGPKLSTIEKEIKEAKAEQQQLSQPIQLNQRARQIQNDTAEGMPERYTSELFSLPAQVDALCQVNRQARRDVQNKIVELEAFINEQEGNENLEAPQRNVLEFKKRVLEGLKRELVKLNNQTAQANSDEPIDEARELGALQEEHALMYTVRTDSTSLQALDLPINPRTLARQQLEYYDIFWMPKDKIPAAREKLNQYFEEHPEVKEKLEIARRELQEERMIATPSLEESNS